MNYRRRINMKPKYSLNQMVRTTWGLATIEQIDCSGWTIIFYKCSMCMNPSTKFWEEENKLELVDDCGNTIE